MDQGHSPQGPVENTRQGTGQPGRALILGMGCGGGGDSAGLSAFVSSSVTDTILGLLWRVAAARSPTESFVNCELDKCKSHLSHEAIYKSSFFFFF